MEFRDYLRLLRRGWPLIVFFTILGIAVSFSYLAVAPRSYAATSTVLVSTQGATSVSELQQGNVFAQQAVTTYAQVAQSPAVLGPVVTRLKLTMTAGALAKEVAVTVVPATTLLQITASDSDAKLSAEIANAVASSTISVIETLAEPVAPATQNLVKLDQIQTAVIPTRAVSPNVQVTMALGLIVGLSIGLVLAILSFALDRRIRSNRDLSAITDRSLLARIPQRRGAKRQPVVVRDDPTGRSGEAFRTLRTNLRFSGASTVRSFVVTSAIHGEGKSLVSTNLAWALADARSTVVLVDTDLRSPAIGTILNLPASAGLSDVLQGQAELDEILQPSQHPRLSVIQAGTPATNPSELLASDEMAQLLKYLEERFEYVILDTAPLLTFTDAAVISASAAGTVVVVSAGKTRRDQLESALVNLSNVGVSPMGLVLNRSNPRSVDPESYVKLSESTSNRTPLTELNSLLFGGTREPRGKQAANADAMNLE